MGNNPRLPCKAISQDYGQNQWEVPQTGRPMIKGMALSLAFSCPFIPGKLLRLWAQVSMVAIVLLRESWSIGNEKPASTQTGHIDARLLVMNFGHDFWSPEPFVLSVAGQNFSDLTIFLSVKCLWVSAEKLVIWTCFSEPPPKQCSFLLEIRLVGCLLINFSSFPPGLGGN